MLPIQDVRHLCHGTEREVGCAHVISRGLKGSSLAGRHVHDGERIAYLRSHLEQCRLAMAIAEGVDLIGYCVWSFTDVLSSLNGHQKRYGLIYIDRDETAERDMRRAHKDSAMRSQDVIATDCAVLWLGSVSPGGEVKVGPLVAITPQPGPPIVRIC